MRALLLVAGVLASFVTTERVANAQLIELICGGYIEQVVECRQDYALLQQDLTATENALRDRIDDVSECHDQVRLLDRSIAELNDALQQQAATCNQTLNRCISDGVAFQQQAAACQGSLGQCQASAVANAAERTQLQALVASLQSTLATTQAELTAARAEITVCGGALASCQGELTDADEDGEIDRTDACLGTAPGEQVDGAGCSIAQFCDTVGFVNRENSERCVLADFDNDEPNNPRDCQVVGHFPARCMPR